MCEPWPVGFTPWLQFLIRDFVEGVEKQVVPVASTQQCSVVAAQQTRDGPPELIVGICPRRDLRIGARRHGVQSGAYDCALGHRLSHRHARCRDDATGVHLAIPISDEFAKGFSLLTSALEDSETTRELQAGNRKNVAFCDARYRAGTATTSAIAAASVHRHGPNAVTPRTRVMATDGPSTRYQ